MQEFLEASINKISSLFNFILHFDRHLDAFVAAYHTGTYLILALIIFCETGLIVAPFLPGDSLLFAAGAVIAKNHVLSFFPMAGILILAALLGDHLNYAVGRFLGRRVLAFPWVTKFAKPEYLLKTEKFFERFGAKAIVLARFIPIVRTFAPFTAGLGKMSYPRYLSFCVSGAVLWVTLLTGSGYLFGDLDVVKNNFELVVLAIIAISFFPMLLEFYRARLSQIAQKVTREHS